jgi:hypothetical protein
MLGIWSCGTRKVNKTNTETTTKNEISVIDSVKIVTKTDSSTEIIADEFEITPVDSLKMLVIIDSQGKKTSYLNARISKRHEISRNKTLKNEIVQSSRKTNIKAVKETKQAVKQIERKESIITSLWWLWLILILIIANYIKKYIIS